MVRSRARMKTKNSFQGAAVNLTLQAQSSKRNPSGKIVRWVDNFYDIIPNFKGFPRIQRIFWKFLIVRVSTRQKPNCQSTSFIWFWKFRNNRVRKTVKIGLMYFSISDFGIYGAYFFKGMTSRPPLKVLKVSLDCLLCPLEPVRLYLLTVKSYGQKLFKKIPFFRQFSTLNPSRFW